MTTDWIDDPDTSFEDKLARAEQFTEVEVRGPLYVLAGPANSFGSAVLQAPDVPISTGSSALRQSISSSKSFASA